MEETWTMLDKLKYLGRQDRKTRKYRLRNTTIRDSLQMGIEMARSSNQEE